MGSHEILAFIAHPISGDAEGNIAKAKHWVRWAALIHHVTPVAPYFELLEAFDEHNPEERELGIKLGMGVLKRCDQLWLCGIRITHGMWCEIEMAQGNGLTIVDFTGVNYPNSELEGKEWKPRLRPS